jgi:pilus assembly protein Flp/PilA
MLEKFTFMTLMFLGDLKAKRDEKGATATEYGLLVGLIALAIGIAVTIFEDALSGFFTSLGGIVDTWA